MLLDRDHGPLGFVEEHVGGVILGDEPPDVVAERRRDGELLDPRARPAGPGRGVAEPDGALLADGVDDGPGGHAGSDHRLHHLLADERIATGRY